MNEDDGAQSAKFRAKTNLIYSAIGLNLAQHVALVDNQRTAISSPREVTIHQFSNPTNCENYVPRTFGSRNDCVPAGYR